MLGEDAHLAYRRDRAIVFPLPHKPALQALGRHTVHLAVAPGAREGDSLAVDIGAKDRDRSLDFEFSHGLLQHDGDGINLLPGGTSCNPNTDRIVGWFGGK